MSNAPTSHVAESLKLTADDTVDLYQIKMISGPVVNFWNGPQRTYNNVVYEEVACQMTGEAVSSDGQYARPLLTIVNPDNSFGVFAAEGILDLATVTRLRLLQSDFKNNVLISQPRVWIVGRPSKVTWQFLQLELRDTTDMPNFKTPRRTFNPPEFPFVVL